ncbi:MAG: adenylate/guanylate cyclase domain-containing protein [Terrimicrobiaceae bacterium]
MSFRTLLLTVVLGLILVSSLLTSAFGLRGVRLAIYALLEKQISTTLEAVTSLVEEHFEPSSRLLETFSRAIQSGKLSLDDPVELAKTFAKALEFEDGIAWISFGYADGSFAGGWTQGGLTVINISRPDGGAPQEWVLDRSGRLEPHANINLPATFDARQRPWFQLALESTDRAWTPPYDFATGERGISVAQAVRAPSGELLGVLTVDFILSDVAAYLDKLTHDFRGEPMVFSINGKLLATPKTMVDSPVVEEVRRLLASQGQGTQFEKEGLVLHIETPHDTYFVGFQTAEIPGGLDCVSAILFSRKVAFEGVDHIVAVTLATALGALGLSLIAGFLLAGRIASPLKALSQVVARVGNFQLEPTPLPKSGIKEVRVLSESVERMRTGLESFSHYVPVDLVRDLVRSGGVAALGGERREISLMFCDLAGFTAYAEKTSPEAAVETLTSYFESFGGAIEESGGVIDKFLGDGIMALFNAPGKIPNPAAAACRAALLGTETFAGCPIQSSAPSSFVARVGLHTGEVLVGNVGTASRFTYTAIGDAVNLCSRLEGLNKAYGTKILASSALRQQAGEEEFLWRRLDRVSVVGRIEPLDIDELMGFRDQATPEALQTATTYSRALEAFLAQCWQDAESLLRELPPDDQPSQMLFHRVALAKQEGGTPTVRGFVEK